jgi:cardiolipin synthase
MSATRGDDAVAADRIWTIPNLLSLLRLLGVPLCLWLALGPHANGWAFTWEAGA